MTDEEFANLSPGDIIRGRLTGVEYVLTRYSINQYNLAGWEWEGQGEEYEAEQRIHTPLTYEIVKSSHRDQNKTVPEHSGNKYHREIVGIEGSGKATVDVYSVLSAFNVTCPARQHAIKKLLCAGIRGKGDVTQDLTEARDALGRAIYMEKWDG